MLRQQSWGRIPSDDKTVLVLLPLLTAPWQGWGWVHRASLSASTILSRSVLAETLYRVQGEPREAWDHDFLRGLFSCCSQREQSSCIPLRPKQNCCLQFSGCARSHHRHLWQPHPRQAHKRTPPSACGNTGCAGNEGQQPQPCPARPRGRAGHPAAESWAGSPTGPWLHPARAQVLGWSSWGPPPQLLHCPPPLRAPCALTEAGSWQRVLMPLTGHQQWWAWRWQRCGGSNLLIDFHPFHALPADRLHP